jgi:cell division protein FtsA
MERIVILEVGTAYTRGMVIEPNEQGTFEILSIHEERSSGIKKSEISNLENASVGIKKVIDDLAYDSNTEIHSVNLIYSGGNPQTEIISGMQPTNLRSMIIEQQCIDIACKNAKEQELPENRILIEDVLLDYILDDSRRVDNPIGMSAKSLTVNYMRLHADKNRLDTIINMLTDNALECEKIYNSGMCSALGATTSKQREDGVLVINFGGGCTNWTAYVGKVPRCVGGIPIGGDHLTFDIQCATKTNHETAEKIKKQAGSATLITEKQRLQFRNNFSDQSILVSDLSKITNARMDETIRIIHEQVANSGCLNMLSAGVVICGGGAALKNITTLVSNIFQLPCTIANPEVLYKNLKPNHPTTAYAALLGAAKCCTRESLAYAATQKRRSPLSKLFEKLLSR